MSIEFEGLVFLIALFLRRIFILHDILKNDRQNLIFWSLASSLILLVLFMTVSLYMSRLF